MLALLNSPACPLVPCMAGGLPSRKRGRREGTLFNKAGIWILDEKRTFFLYPASSIQQPASRSLIGLRRRELMSSKTVPNDFIACDLFRLVLLETLSMMWSLPRVTMIFPFFLNTVNEGLVLRKGP
jgi:hypothetical protein